MQDKDFDRFIQQALENQPEPEYNPADWDKLEDRLHNLNTAQPNPAGASAGSAGLGKLGFVASAILVTAINVVFFAKPALLKNAVEEHVTTAIQTHQSEILTETTPDVMADNVFVESATSTSIENSTLPAEPNLDVPAVEAPFAIPATVAERSLNNSSENSAKLRPASRTTINNKAVKVAGKNNRTATTNWAWPAVAAGRSGSHSSNNGLSAGQPVAIVQPCNPAFKPEIATVLIGKDTLHSNRITLSSCAMLEARIFIKGESAEKITLTSNVAKSLPGARLVHEAGSNLMLVHWQPVPEMARQEPYNFTLWLADERCANATPRAYEFAVQVNPAFTAALNGVTRISKGQETTLEVEGAPLGSTFQWLTGNKIIAENETGRLVAAPSKATTYRVMVTAPTGCVFADSLRVDVAPGDILASAKAIPNIFTPNNDGLNDYFEIMLPEAGPHKLEVFDRDGNLVYAQNQYDNKWNAAKLASGTYYYIITTPKEKKTYKGWVEIMR